MNWVFAASVLLASTAANACGGIYEVPCAPQAVRPLGPTTITPQFGGGYNVNRPGQMPTQITPNLGGGYTVRTPGQVPSTCTPQLGGGVICR